jgi:tetratricopeptide (TPR) repeat protein
MTEARLKKILTLLIAAATFVGSGIVYFAVEAGGRAADASRNGRLKGIEYVAFIGRELWGMASDRTRMGAYLELEALRRYEEMNARFRRGSEAAAARMAEERWRGALEAVSASGGIFDSRNFDKESGRFDPIRHYADLIVEPSVRILQEEDLEKTRAQFWSRKANVYTTSLTVLAVAVFLLTLALSIPARVRILFAATGLALIAGLTGVCLATRATALILFNEEDIGAFSRISSRVFVLQGYGLVGDLERELMEADAAVAEADALVRKSPRYTAAVMLRGMARQLKAEALFYRNGPGRASDEELEQALSDYGRALESRPDDGPLTWSMAYCLFLAGKHEAALSKLRRAAELLTEQKFGLGLNEAVYLLHLGRRDESREAFLRAVRQAAEQKRGSDPFYFRTVIRNVGRLGEIRPVAGLEELEESLKEALISISTFGRAEPEPVGASVKPLRFVGLTYDDAGNIVDITEQDVFPLFTEEVSYIFEYENVEPGREIAQRVYWRAPGRAFWREQVHLAKSEKWSGKPEGRSAWKIDFPLPRAGRGLPGGDYRVEFYVQGNLLSRGSFAVR